jgi:membrane-bound metal-dependent hydrolase YbcI (DUF457 family)
MPFTPFHFGPGLLFGFPLRRRMDFVTFLIANVIVDVRATLVYFGFLSGPLHGPLHTYLGAFVLALVLAGSVLLFSRRFPSIAQRVSSRPRSLTAVGLASIAGTWSHVTLDAILYPAMQPFYPISGNPWYGLTSLFVIYGLCVLAFLIGGGVTGISIIWNRWRASGA